MNSIIIGIIASLLTSIVTQYIVRKNYTDTVKENYKKKYFDKTFDCYLKFWSLLRPLSRYYDDKTIIKYVEGKLFLNAANIEEFIDSINEFFFSELGIFLSREIRKELFEFRDLLVAHLKDLKTNNWNALSNEESKKIKSYREKLFNIVRDDIGILNIKFDVSDFRIDNGR